MRVGHSSFLTSLNQQTTPGQGAHRGLTATAKVTLRREETQAPQGHVILIQFLSDRVKELKFRSTSGFTHFLSPLPTGSQLLLSLVLFLLINCVYSIRATA